MNSPINLKQRTTNKFFSKVFSKKYKEWNEKTHKTQQDFAEECEMQNKNSVSNWSTGKQIPKDDTFEKILRVFNEAGIPTTIEDFIPHTPDDTYHHDPQRVKGIQDHSREFARSIGLSDGFLDFITSHTDFSDPDEGYPIWSPLALYPSYINGFDTNEKELEYLKDRMFVTEYHRRPLATTHAVSDDRSYTVPMEDGTSFLLSEIDLRILKDLQDKVVDVVKYFYFKRKKEMKEQEINAIKQANPSHYDEVHNQTVMYDHILSKDELIAIDLYMQYLKWVDKDGKEV